MPKTPEAKALIERAIEEIKKKKEFDKDAGGLLASIEEGLVKAIGPALEKAVASMTSNVEKSMKGFKMDAPNIAMPEMELDMTPVAEAVKEAISEAFKGVSINVPEVKMPTINVPEMKMPAINIPPQVINEVQLKGVGTKNPMPVAIYGLDGKPLLFPFGSSGAKANFITLKGMLTPNGDSMIDEANDALNVSLVSGTINAAQASGAADSMNVIQLGGNAIATDSGVTGAGVLRVVHATDVATSVNVVAFTSSVAVVLTTPAGTDITDETNDAVRVNVVAGSLNANTEYNDGATPDQAGGIGIISAIFDGGSVQTALGSSYGIQQVQLSDFDGSLLGVSTNPLPVVQTASMEVKQVSGTESSVVINSSLVSFEVKQVSGTQFSTESHTHALDSTGAWDQVRMGTGVAVGGMRVVQASDSVSSVNVVTLNGVAPDLGAGAVGTGTMRIVVGSDSTTAVVGDVLADAADTGGAPLKTGGIARQANPTAVAAGDRVASTYDDVGRQVMRINQVRDLVQTAYATLSNGSETTLLAGASGVFHDLIYIMGANDSDAAVTVDIRAATGANKAMTLKIPANGTAGVSLSTPHPQDVAADTWTADMPDITGTNVYLTALFSKEV